MEVGAGVRIYYRMEGVGELRAVLWDGGEDLEGKGVLWDGDRGVYNGMERCEGQGHIMGCGGQRRGGGCDGEGRGGAGVILWDGRV